jgi:predicted transcriptional regulator
MVDEAPDVDELFRAVVDRLVVLEQLSEGVETRRELERHLDASRTTVHRIVTKFREAGLVTETDGVLALTGVGHYVTDEVVRCRERLQTAHRLEPLIDAIEGAGLSFDAGLFAEAEVTTADARNPYRPVAQLTEFIGDSTRLRGAYKIVPNPMYVDRLYDGLLAGGDSELVYERGAAEEIVDMYPEKAERALGAGDVSVYVVGELPFGVTVADGKAALAAYDDASGVLELVAVTTDPDREPVRERTGSERAVVARRVTRRSRPPSPGPRCPCASGRRRLPPRGRSTDRGSAGRRRSRRPRRRSRCPRAVRARSGRYGPRASTPRRSLSA